MDEGRCGEWWKEVRVNMGEVKEVLGNREVVGEVVGRLGLEREWEGSVGVLRLLVGLVIGCWNEKEKEMEMEDYWG